MRVARNRARGCTHAFVSGCFDLLNTGHVRYLEAARRDADRLIVAVTDDQAVGGLAGASRPIVNASDRAELVAALRAVDYVVIIDEPSVAPLLTLLEPEVRCPGARDVDRATRDLVARISRRESHTP